MAHVEKLFYMKMKCLVDTRELLWRMPRRCRGVDCDVKVTWVECYLDDTYLQACRVVE